MIQLKGGWAQWDPQLGTFRAQIDSIIFGNFAGEFLNAQALADIIGVMSPEDVIALDQENTSIVIDPSGLPPEYLTPDIAKIKIDLAAGVQIPGIVGTADLTSVQITLVKVLDTIPLLATPIVATPPLIEPLL